MVEERVARDGANYTFKEFLKFYGQGKNVARAQEEWAQAILDCTGACCPKCRKEDIELDFCTFSVHRWKVASKQKASGADRYPYWPLVKVDGCKELGCKRLGRRSESYILDMVEI